MFALKVSGLEHVFVLAGGEELETLQSEATAGNRVRVTGLMHPSHGEEPPGLTVQRFRSLARERGFGKLEN